MKSPSYRLSHHIDTTAIEGFASGAELQQYQYRDGAFYLGDIHPDHGEFFNAGVYDDRHVFIVAGNAAGKGRSLGIQNAIRWKGGLFAIDVKGEIASITAMRRGTKAAAQGTGTSVRQHLEQDVAILDPEGETQGAARCYLKRYNPLDEIDMQSDKAQSHIRKIASACIVPEEGKNSWVSDGAETILAGVIEVIKTAYPKEQQNLVFVRRLLLHSFKNLMEEFTRDGLPPDGLAAEAVAMLGDVLETDEAGSYRGCLSNNLKWLSEPRMQKHIEASDVSLFDLMKTGGSVYVVVPPDQLKTYRSWLRIITQSAINVKIRLGVNQTTQPTMFLLDEFALLGNFKEIEESAAFLRGYSCKLVMIIQNIGQIKKHYEKNWETFLGNAGVIVGFALNDLETEEYLSNRMGKILAWETSFSISDGASDQEGGKAGSNTGKTTSQAQHERSVRTPNEIHEQTARHTMRAFAIPADGKPIIIERKNYDDISKPVFDSPQFCQQWEMNYVRFINAK